MKPKHFETTYLRELPRRFLEVHQSQFSQTVVQESYFRIKFALLLIVKYTKQNASSSCSLKDATFSFQIGNDSVFLETVGNPNHNTA